MVHYQVLLLNQKIKHRYSVVVVLSFLLFFICCSFLLFFFLNVGPGGMFSLHCNAHFYFVLFFTSQNINSKYFLLLYHNVQHTIFVFPFPPSYSAVVCNNVLACLKTHHELQLLLFIVPNEVWASEKVVK